MSYAAKYKNERCEYCGHSIPFSDLKEHEDTCPFNPEVPREKSLGLIDAFEDEFYEETDEGIITKDGMYSATIASIKYFVEKHIRQEKKKLAADVIEAWEALSSGHYTSKTINNWLSDVMAPMINELRKLK